MKGKHNFKHFYYIHIVEITYPKGRALMKMYRVVPQTKRGNCIYLFWYLGTHVTRCVYTKLSLFRILTLSMKFLLLLKIII